MIFHFRCLVFFSFSDKNRTFEQMFAKPGAPIVIRTNDLG